jgi:hypothetical protein
MTLPLNSQRLPRLLAALVGGLCVVTGGTDNPTVQFAGSVGAGGQHQHDRARCQRGRCRVR